MSRSNRFGLPHALLFLLLLLPSAAAAQDSDVSGGDSLSIVPGPDYAAGSFHRFFWGDHYRDVWTTEIRVPVLDLQTYAGGLTPISAGGGYQTKSLWLRGADGKIYAFRSIYKNAGPLVPPVLRNTYVEDLFQDQMSTQLPYAPLVVAPLLEAVGILQTRPDLYVLPNEPSLGQFRAGFAGVFGTLAERPDVNERQLASFLGAREIIDGFDLVERVQADPSKRVHSRSFLAARLIDVLVGDWDRHADQWRWADFASAASPGWRPIPSDRDQAFARLDGLILSIGRGRFPMLASFSRSYDNISRYHYQARFIDRLFLTELERPVWDSTAAAIAGRLSDDVIDAAVARMPSEARDVDGRFISTGLKARRDALPDASTEMYELLAREPYVHASNLADIAEVSGARDGVQIVLRTASPGSEPYFHRTFLREETKEVRLYLHGGNDRAVIQGEQKLPIRVRIIGGEGDDEFHFTSTVAGVRLYDQHGANQITGEGSTSINSRPYSEPPLVPESGTPAPARHWGSFGYPFFVLGYNPDVGFLAGGSHVWFDYGFRKDPYASRVKASAAAATALKAALRVNADFRFENSPLFVGLDAYGTSMEILHFYGVGNNTKLSEGVAGDFHDVENTRIQGEATLRADYGRNLDLGLGLIGGFSNTKDDPSTFFGQNPDIYGAGRFGYLGAVARLDLTARRPGILVETGVKPRGRLSVRGQYHPAFLDVASAYGWLDAVGATSLPLGFRRWEVGFRAGARKLWGEAPWFHLAFIGGNNSLRGWPSQRFAGDASLYGSLELRLDLFNYRLVFPSTFGILGLVDAGRIWVDGESPGGWHSGYGGGVWLALRGTRSVVSFAYAESDEDKGLYINLGFPF
ncbi:MAG: hypothetical protein JSU87_04745 [Gemmatimonadota bacterium]|nr:MAG: hypothetical protein JSU87_04745 [Gemmatimonadota bacterium]